MAVKVLIIISFLLGTVVSYSQIRSDYVWFSGGYQPSLDIKEYFLLDFKKAEHERIRPLKNTFATWFFHDNSSICDLSGNFKYLTNGCIIADSTLKPIANKFDNSGLECIGGYPILYSSLLLNRPGDTSKYDYFYLRIDKTTQKWLSTDFKHTELNIEDPDSTELVPELIQRDTFANSTSAVRHGNGRDWWIFGQKLGGGFYRTLLTPSGIEPAIFQDIEPEYSSDDSRIYMYDGQICFSPNGKHLATYYAAYGLCIYDVDRCSGLLSNPRRFYLDTNRIDRAGGVAFSENSQFLYCFSWRHAYQMDIQSPDIEKSIILLDTFDGFESPPFFITAFWQPRLGPDGRIYVGTPNTTDYWHVIESPNLPGKACNFKQHAFKLPTYCGAPPNIPYYRSGPDKGSPCDTIKQDAPPECALEFFPNPADHSLNIEVCESGTPIDILDILGRNVYHSEELSGPQLLHVDTKEWAPGTYFIRPKQSGQLQKVIIQH